MPKVRRALLSVYDKRGIVPFAKRLVRQGVKILSTGKTASVLRKGGIPVQEISEYTGYPELLNGRIKTLHPKIHAGILADRANRSHMKSLKARGIDPIDLVVVDLYPFEEGVQKKGMSVSKAIELIDIGGVTLLRAAAKNSRYVTVVPGPTFYDVILKELKRRSGIRDQTNRKLAYEAFLKTSHYDQAIRDFFGEAEKEALPESLDLAFRKTQELRYGENPHQKGALYLDAASGVEPHLLSLQGKSLSFNNLLDLDAAYRIVREFQKPCVAIIKHAGPCGVGLGRRLEEAFQKAWACDPESAFGGVIGLNRTLSTSVARRILESGFFEVIAFPKIEKGALRLLKRRKNLRLVPFDALYKTERSWTRDVKSLFGSGLLVQTEDRTELKVSRLRSVTKRKPTREEANTLLFAFQVAKHVRSNAIVIARDGATVGIGGGQPSRVGSVHVALEKAGEKAVDAVLASDGFFPFADGVEGAARAGIRAIIQPGGSIRDREVIQACNRDDITMVFTGIRHFKH